jgi:hypothetical protein
MIAGLVAFVLIPDHDYFLFSAINLRFIAVPALALDHYADFFAHRALTHFCQISIVRYELGCRYGELGPTLAAVYRDGNFNASFLATEGIASVGFMWAPVSALVCGLILSIGSLFSRHLSPRFVAVSSAIAVQTIMNVPLTTGLLYQRNSSASGCPRAPAAELRSAISSPGEASSDPGITRCVPLVSEAV